MTDNITLPRKHIDYAAHALEHFNKDAPDPLVSEIVHHLRTALAAEREEHEMTDLRKAAELALEALEESPYFGEWQGLEEDALIALRNALAAEQPKPSEDIVAGGEAGSGDIVFKGFIDSQSADSLGRIANAIERLAAEQPKQEPVAWMDRFGFVFRGKGPHETFTTPLYTAPPDASTVKESLTHPGYVIGSHWLETAYSRICAGEAEADVLRDCGWERVDQALRRDAERYRKQKERSYRLQRLLKECVKVMQANAVFRDTKAHKDLKTRIRAELEDKT